MITRRISYFDCFGTMVEDSIKDAEQFNLTLDNIEHLGLDDVHDLRFTFTGEEADLAAYAEFYDVEFDS